MASKRPEKPPEVDLYPIVQKWMVRQWDCFASKFNVGSRFGRIDVAGVRDIGGDLSGQTEVIAIEVKAGGSVFTTSAGQAFGYSVYANRVYLADYRPTGTDFSPEEIAIAGRLGIGLLLIRPNHRINVVQTSPLHEPMERLRRTVIAAMDHAVCSICESVFPIKDEDGRALVKRGDYNSRKPLQRAIEAEMGYVWWLSDVGERDGTTRGGTYPRRYLCRDCAWGLFHEAIPAT
jgi:hypothetical protein